MKLVIDKLTEHLRKDEGYYYAWQANIAMAFYDEFRRSKPKNLTQVHKTANEAAKNFLDMLINLNENYEKSKYVVKD
jgi:hypothetical protein